MATLEILKKIKEAIIKANGYPGDEEILSYLRELPEDSRYSTLKLLVTGWKTDVRDGRPIL